MRGIKMHPSSKCVMHMVLSQRQKKKVSCFGMGTEKSMNLLSKKRGGNKQTAEKQSQ